MSEERGGKRNEGRGIFLLLILALALFAPPSSLLSSTAHAEDWKELKSDHFIIYYVDSDDFANITANKAESYYKKIADDLGYARYSNFWQWDNRVKIYIYPDRASFIKGTGQPEWSYGVARYDKKEISSYSDSKDFLDGLLPHEMTHLIFRDFVGFKGQVPLWMDEGVAQWEEPEKRRLVARAGRYLIAARKDLVLQDLMATDIRQSNDEEKVRNFYIESVSVVDFMIKTFGAQAFTEFCRQLRDGKSFGDALHAAFPSVESLYELDQRWRKFVGPAPPEAETEIFSSGWNSQRASEG